MADGWPLQSYLELGALPGAVPCARLHARHVLREWGLTALRDDAELLVSELVTNAVHASRSMEWSFPVRLRLLSDRTQVLIVVWDANPEPPVRTEAADDDENGRGLMLVETISERWDWSATPDAGGKMVWCIVRELPRRGAEGFRLLDFPFPPEAAPPRRPDSRDDQQRPGDAA